MLIYMYACLQIVLSKYVTKLLQISNIHNSHIFLTMAILLVETMRLALCQYAFFPPFSHTYHKKQHFYLHISFFCSTFAAHFDRSNAV